MSAHLSSMNPERDAVIVRLRETTGLSYARVGLMYGISRQRVHQICVTWRRQHASRITHHSSAEGQS